MDVLGCCPPHALECDRFQALDLAGEVVVLEAVVDDVEQAAKDAARPLEGGRITTDEAGARLLELILGYRAAAADVLEFLQCLDHRLFRDRRLDGAAGGEVRAAE